MKSFKHRLKLSYLDELKLNTLSNEHRLLYNHLLSYVKTNGCDFGKLHEISKNFRIENNLTINAKSVQNTSRNLIASIKGFFSRRKKDKTANFPYKFKGFEYFCSFTYDWNAGCGGFKFEENELILQGGLLNFNLTSLPGDIGNKTIKTITFTKDFFGRYFVCMTYSENETNTIRNDNICSVDLGCSNIATCFVSNNDSFSIENTTYKSLEKRCELVQSIKSKYKNGSRRHKKISRTFRKLKSKLVNKNKDFQHKASKVIINKCKENNIGNVIIGDIDTKTLTKSKVANKRLNKSTQARGTLSRFKTFLEYKAKNEGMITKLQEESYTSKTNCLTHELFINMNLSMRNVKIKDDLVIDRDLNGAINIAQKAMGIWLPQLENYLNSFGFHKIYIDNESCLCKNKSYTSCNLYNFV